MVDLLRTHRLKLVPLLVLFMALSAGCWDRREPENLAWVAAIGVDKGPGNDFVFTFQITSPRAATAAASSGGGGASGSQQGGNFEVYSVEAPDVVSGAAMTDAFIARRISLQHAKILIIGERVARDGIAPVLAAATRYQEFRRTMTMAVARGSARELIEHVRPRLENDPAFWYELMNLWQKETALVPITRIHDFVTDYEQPGLGARAALVAVNNTAPEELTASGEGEPKESGLPPLPADAIAGQVHRSGGVPVDFAGTAVFRRDRLVGLLSGTETRLVGALRGELLRTPFSVADPLDPNHRLVLMLRQQSKPQVQVQRRGTQVKVSFRVSLEADIASIPSRVDYTDPVKMARLERSVEAEFEQRSRRLLTKTLHEWRTDLYGVGDRLRSTFVTNRDWQAFNWGKRISEATYEVQVDFRVRRHGLNTEPAQPPPGDGS